MGRRNLGDLFGGAFGGGAEHAFFGEQADGAHALGFGQGGHSAVGLGQPDFDVGEACFDDFDEDQFFRVDAGEGEDQGAIDQGAAGEFGHGGVGVVEFGALEAEALESGDGSRAGRGAAND